MISHYYHIFVDGNWRKPWSDHMKALKGLPVDRFVVGVVGSPLARRRFLREVGDVVPRYVGWDEGYEQQTLRLIHEDLGNISGHVLYAHSKGAFHDTDVNMYWRRCMTRNLVNSHAYSYALDYDVVGCHWLTPEEYPEQVQIPYFGGNFWWSSVEHLGKLSPPSDETRYHAEAWLGTVRPDKVLDLAPGWPGLGCSQH